MIEPPETTVKILSLWNPWAHFMRLGLKTIETRHWTTKYRGVLYIQATKKWNTELRRLCGLNSLYYVDGKPLTSGHMHFGMVVARGILVDVVPVGRLSEQWFIDNQRSEHERTFGDYSSGRFAWIFEGMEWLHMPVKLVGRQQIFNWTPNPDIAKNMVWSSCQRAFCKNCGERQAVKRGQSVGSHYNYRWNRTCENCGHTSPINLDYAKEKIHGKA